MSGYAVGVPAPHLPRVASVPAQHPYVSRLSPCWGPPAFVLLPGPAPSRDGSWTPSPVLDPRWLREHADDVDLVHVHFGFEHRSREQLVAFVEALRSLAVPLIVTVHDLVNPHLTDQRAHVAALDVLVPAADHVLTLTPGAAREIQQRWRRSPIVVPHPHVVDVGRMTGDRPAHEGFVVGVQAKRRANIDPGPVHAELVAAVTALPGGRLQAAPQRWLTDAELWDHLADLDLLVLPYRFGTHSGLLEACYDVGTAVAVPEVGYFHEQHPTYAFDLDVAGSVTEAVRRTHLAGPARPADPQKRALEQEQLARVHADLYAAAARGRRAA